MTTPGSPGGTAATPGERAPAGARRGRQPSFLSVLGHELRNHVAPIQNALFLMRRHTGEASIAPLVDLVERQLQAIIQSYERLADAERIAANDVALHRERINLGEQVQRALEPVHALAAGRESRVHTTLPSAPVYVEGDATRLAQAFTTMIRNALAFTANEGEVWIDMGTDGTDAIVRVRDSGGGMDHETLAHAFEFFATRGDASHGLGVNLAVANRIVTLHGGSIVASSAGAGKGTEFVVRLPLIDAGPMHNKTRASVQDSRAEADAGTAARPKRVLIADDSAPLRETLSTVLRGMGHEVRIAVDGEEALAIAQSWQPDFALLDIYMPKLTGFVVARELRTRFPSAGMRLVMMSGHDLDESTLLDAGQAGFDHCIDKAFTLEALERLLKE